MPRLVRATRWSALGVLAAPALACSAPDQAGDTDSATVAALPARGPAALDAVSGTLRLIEGTLHFAHCGAAGNGAALSDGTGGDAGSIVSELGPDQGVTALVDIEGSQLTAVHYAAPEGAPCTDLPPTPEIEARGQEPFWYVSVSNDMATVRTPDELDGVEYTDGRWSVSTGTTWRYEASRADESLALELVRVRCTDGMSGARYPLKATLTRNGTAMTGCALPGRGAP